MQKAKKGTVVFFDFKAAFPSVAQDFLIESLSLLGLPAHAISFLRALYDSNKCMIAYKGAIYDGFGMERGVRQGCPLSPLIYAVAAPI